MILWCPLTSVVLDKGPLSGSLFLYPLMEYKIVFVNVKVEKKSAVAGIYKYVKSSHPCRNCYLQASTSSAVLSLSSLSRTLKIGSNQASTGRRGAALNNSHLRTYFALDGCYW